MSPGNTAGTEVARDFPLPVRLLMKHVLVPLVMPLFGIVQDVEKGAKRLVDGLHDPTLDSGVFYGSKADALVGPVVDQSTIFPELADATYQDNAATAVRRFIHEGVVDTAAPSPARLAVISLDRPPAQR